MISALIPAVSGLIGKAIDRAVPDKDQAAKLKAQVQSEANELAHTELQGAVDIIKAEAGSEHKLAAIWRPILMLVIVAIVANNFILAPYLSAMFGWSVSLELPEQLWNLMTLGVGGYIGGRSAEKAIKTWKNNGSKQ